MTITRILRFIIVLPRVPADGSFLLKDLPGSGGRVDILCRCLAACFDWAPEKWPAEELELVAILSHTVRLVFKNPGLPRPVGERAWAQIIKDSLEGHPPKYVTVDHATVEDTLEELTDQPESRVWVLDEDGIPITSVNVWECATQNSFMLGDHKGFDSRVQKAIGEFDLKHISLGAVTYLSSHCIATVIAESETEL